MFDLYSMTSQCTSRCCRYHYKRKNWSWAWGTNYQSWSTKVWLNFDKNRIQNTKTKNQWNFIFLVFAFSLCHHLCCLKSRTVKYEVNYTKLRHREFLPTVWLFPPLATTSYKLSSLLPNCIWFGHNVTSNALFQESTKRRLKLIIHARAIHTCHAYSTSIRT